MPAGTAAFFASLGLPPALTYLTIAAEIGGALLLIAGLYTRIAAVALLPVLLGAIVFVHGANGWMFTAKGRRLGVPRLLVARPDRAGAGRRRRVRARRSAAADAESDSRRPAHRAA